MFLDLTLGGLGYAMIICLMITSGVTLFAFLQYRSARAGFASLGPGLLMMGARIIGGVIGMLLAISALLRGEPGEWLLWSGLCINLVFLLKF